MTHQAPNATTNVCEHNLIQRAALALSEALDHWAETSAQSRYGSPINEAQVNARRRRLHEAEDRREEALRQSFLMPRPF